MRGWIDLFLIGFLLLAGCAMDSSSGQELKPDEQYLFPDISAPSEEVEPVAEPPRCTDSDGGFDLHIKGTATVVEDGKVTWEKEDFCFDSNTLYEYYCQDGTIMHESTRCPCSDGVCEPVLSYMECSDSDGGNNKLERGKITLTRHYTDGSTTVESPVEDECISKVELIEYFCKDDGTGWRKYTYTCIFCSDGECSQ